MRVPDDGTNTPPAKKPKSLAFPFGSQAAAGPFAGAGIMLGSNPDVWKQARELVDEGLIQVVAVIPGTTFDFGKARVVTWQPPEQQPDPLHTNILQAENQAQWDANRAALEQITEPRAWVLNHWAYGEFPARTVALVEAYANDGPVDFGGPVAGSPNGEVFTRYRAAGAAAVIAVPGLYTSARPDEEAADVYRSLPHGLPGVMGYAGEDMISEEILPAIREVWGRYSV